MGAVRRRRSWAKTGAMALAVAGLTACFPPPPEASGRLAEVKASRAELNEALDTLEERLLGNQARLHFWSELAVRHQRVSEVACRNQNGHLEQMVALLQRQEQKAQKLRKGRWAKKEKRAPAVGGPREAP